MHVRPLRGLQSMMTHTFPVTCTALSQVRTLLSTLVLAFS